MFISGTCMKCGCATRERARCLTNVVQTKKSSDGKKFSLGGIVCQMDTSAASRLKTKKKKIFGDTAGIFTFGLVCIKHLKK